MIRRSRVPAAAPRRVRDRLRAAPDGPARVVHRGPHALYLEVHPGPGRPGWCVGVVDDAAVAVPCALRTAGHALRSGLGGVSAEVVAGALHLDGVPVVVGRLVDVAVPRLRVAGPFPPQPTDDQEAWVARLLGAGDGLTPYGDDVLCGWLAIHRAAGVPTPAVDAAVHARLARTTLLSATLLDCAMHGEVVPAFGAWVRALGTPAEPRAAAALAAVGHSSGRGLLAGARQALAALAAGGVAA